MFHRIVATGALLLSGAACFAQDVPQKPLEVLHSFVTEGERAALSVYRDQFIKDGGEWVDSAMNSGGQVRATVVRRALGGDPPGAAFHQNKISFGELVEGGLLRDITHVAEAEGWAAVMTPEAYDNITIDGRVYAAPVQTQSVNFLYSSMPVLAAAGVTEHPTTFAQLFEALEKVKANSPDIVPFAMSNQDNDMRRVFTATIAGVAGPEVYRRVYVENDAEAVKSPEFRAAVEAFRRLSTFADSGWTTREWNDSTNLLISNRAAFQLMGDWAKGALVDAGLTPKDQFGCSFLGDVVVASGSVFIFPQTNDDGIAKAQDLLATVVMMRELQVPFSLAKGTIPSRSDVDTSSLDACSSMAAAYQGDAAKSVQDDNRLVSPQTIGDMQDLIKSYWSSDAVSTDQFIDQFAATIAAAKG